MKGDLSMAMTMGGDVQSVAPPSWVPLAPSGAVPLVFLDFKNGNYWAAGEVTNVASVIDQPLLVVGGVGLVLPVPFTPPNIIGNAFTAIAQTGALYTAVLDFSVQGPEVLNLDVSAFYVAIGEDYVYWSDLAWGWDAGVPSSWSQFFTDRVTPTGGGGNGSQWDLADDTPPPQGLPDGKIAGTMNGAHTAVSFNGSSLATQTITHNGAETTNHPVVTVDSGPAFTPTEIRLFNDATNQASPWTVRSLTVYAPQPDTDLPTLST